MSSLLAEFTQLHAVVSCSPTGEALEATATGVVDADTLCAIATVSAKQFRGVGELLSAGELQRWYLVTEAQTCYVSERPSGRLVALGESTKAPESTSKALHKAHR